MCQYQDYFKNQCPFDPEPNYDRCIFHLPIEHKKPEQFWHHLANYLLALYDASPTQETKIFLNKPPWIINEKDPELLQYYRGKITSKKIFDFTGFIFPEMDEKHNFHGFLFPAIALFYDTQFQNADFSGAQFHQYANFFVVEFNGAGYFRHTVFTGKIDFTRARICNRLLFSGTEINNNALILLWDLDFVHGISNFTLNQEQTAGQIVAPAGQVVFQDISQNINRVSFLHTEIFSDRLFIRFQNVNWKTARPEQFIYDASLVFKTREKDWCELIQNNDLEPLYEIFYVEPEETTETDRFRALQNLVTADVERIAREIRRSTEQFGSYSDAGNYYIAEMHYRRKRPGTPTFEKIILFFYNLFSRYGESPKQAAIWLVVTWLLPVFLYMYTGFSFGTRTIRYELKPLLSFRPEIIRENFFDLIHSLGFAFINLIPGYFRFLSKENQGSGTLTPFIALVQAVFGIILLTLFLLAIRRRFHR
ncbi:MAG: pentapeptide repeat-containing protein [candidate division WOR-3 bacterium]